MKTRHLTLAALCALLPLSAPAMAQQDDVEKPSFGFAGVLSASNSEDLPQLTLGAGKALSEAPWKLKSGTYYEFEIVSDGSQELALVGPEFFRAVWIDEIVINGLEVRPLGLDSVEFDKAGTMEIGFLAIKPGRYALRVPGSTGETQRVEITIE